MTGLNTPNGSIENTIYIFKNLRVLKGLLGLLNVLRSFQNVGYKYPAVLRKNPRFESSTSINVEMLKKWSVLTLQYPLYLSDFNQKIFL
jgi:hypothetical protein